MFSVVAALSTEVRTFSSRNEHKARKLKVGNQLANLARHMR